MLLTELLDTHNLKILNEGPTARTGHTLDLIIAPEQVNIVENLNTYDYFGTVHYFIEFDIPISRKSIIKNEIEYRSLQNFNPSRFIDECVNDLEVNSTLFCSCNESNNERTISNCVNFYTMSYNKKFSDKFNSMCPLVT